MNSLRLQRTGRLWREVMDFLVSILALAAITAVCFRFDFQLETPTMLSLLVIVFLSLRASFLTSAMVSVIATGCLIYFFVNPLFTFKIVTIVDFVAISTFLITAGVITHLVASVRRLMQEKLQRSESYLAEAQQLSHTGSFGWKVSTGDLVWSEETCRLLDYPPQTRPSLDLLLQRIHPEDAALMRHTLENASVFQNDFQVTVRLLLPPKVLKHVQIVAHAQKRDTDQCEYIGAMMDITERRNSEATLHKAQVALAHTTRLTTLGELTASIAHEVNQPLAAIVTNASAGLRWLDRATPNLTEAQEAFKRIALDGTRGSEVIARVRRMVRKAQPGREPVDINAVIRETIALAQMDLQGTTLITHLADALPRLEADPVQLQQVLLNLILNAIDAMETVTDRPHELRIETRSLPNQMISVTIQDSGHGIDARQAASLFETFYTTKPDGLGMGLSICRSIIEGHGGRLSVVPGTTPGATFQFTLPISPAGQP